MKTECDPHGNIVEYLGEEICLVDLKFCTDEQRNAAIEGWLDRIKAKGGGMKDAAKKLKRAVMRKFNQPKP